MRGLAGNPRVSATWATSRVLAPRTDASRSTGTSVQFRQTKACSRSGKWGIGTGAGVGPEGSRASAFGSSDGCVAALALGNIAMVPAVARALVAMNSRLELFRRFRIGVERKLTGKL